MIDAGTAVLKIKPDFNAASGEVASEGRGIFGGLGKSMALAFAGAFVIDKGIDFFKDTITQAREAIQVQAQTAQVIKSTGGAAGISAEQVKALGEKLSGLDGISHNTIQSTENLLLTFTNIKDLGGDKNIFSRATGLVQDLSVAMKEDGKSAAVQLGKALNDPVKGVTALRRVGVQFSADQIKVIDAMVKTGNVAGAQGLILDEVAKEFGGSAAAQADPIKKLGVQWEDLKEKVGLAVLPVLNKLVGVLAADLPKAMAAVAGVFHVVRGAVDDFISGFKFGSDLSGLPGMNSSVWAEWGDRVFTVFDTAREFVKEFINGFTAHSMALDAAGTAWEHWGKTAHDAWTAVQDAGSAAWAVLGPVFNEIGSVLGGELQPILLAAAGAVALLIGNAAFGAVVGVLGGVVAALTSPIVLLAALTVGLITAYEHSTIFKNIVNDSFKLAKSAIIDAKDAVVFLSEKLFELAVFIDQSKIGDVLRKVGDDALQAFKDAGNAIDDLIKKATKGLDDLRAGGTPSVPSVPTPDFGTSDSGMQLIRDGMKSLWQNVRNDTSQAWQGIASDIGQDLINLAPDVQTFSQPFLATFRAIWAQLGDIGRTEIQTARTVLGDLFSDKTIFDLLRDAAAGGMHVLHDVLNIGLLAIGGLWDVNWGAIRSKLASIWVDIRTEIGTGMAAAVGFFAGLAVRADNALGDTRHVLLHKGIDLVGGIVDGVGSATGWLGATVRNLGGIVMGAFGGAGGWLVGAGQAIVSGLIHGIASMVESAASAAAGLVHKIISTATGILHIGSPSKVFMDIGGHIGEGLQLGIQGSAAGAQAAMRDLVSVGGLTDMAVGARPVTRDWSPSDAALAAQSPGPVQNITQYVTALDPREAAMTSQREWWWAAQTAGS